MSVVFINIDKNDGNGWVDYTDYVLFSSASFESQLSAVAGTFEITISDTERVLNFATGCRVQLIIDGQVYFGGYVTQVVRKLAVPVADTRDMSKLKVRQWVLRGTDYNILFDKRVIWYKADGVEAIPEAAAGLTDKQLISLLCGSYLSLENDGIDYDTYVEEVNEPTTGTNKWVFAGTEIWRKEMEALEMKTGALWYIDHERNLVYKTYEGETPVWSFSDRPDNTKNWFGFREFEFVEDGSNVVNDALIWGGAAIGSSTGTPVFARTQNTISQNGDANHPDPVTSREPTYPRGRWQLAETHFDEPGFFEQDGVAARGSRIVFGNPGSTMREDQRGLQYPQQQIRCSWFGQGVPSALHPGMVMTFYLYSFGFGGLDYLGEPTTYPLQVTLPLRQIRISFESPQIARFEGFFGIQTSDPWSLWKYLRAASNKPSRPVIPAVVTSDGTQDDVPYGTQTFVTPTLKVGTTNVYVVPYGYIGGQTWVYLNGLLQRTGVDYTESSPSAGEITLTFVLETGDELWMRYYALGTT